MESIQTGGDIMTFEEALATQAAWIQYWVMAMGIVIAATIIVLLFSRPTRRDAVSIAATMAATFLAMNWLYGQIGYVRLLGIVHVILWTPLVIYLWRRLQDASITPPFRQMIWLLIATLTVSLAFDYADVIRYLLGEQGSMIPA
ncbi:MAG: hypothetical protein ACR2O4_09980 [Hyphomicrobiaceae bacterium]